MLSEVFVKDKLTQNIAATIIQCVSTGIGIHELQKRGLIGQRMIVFLAVLQVLNVIDCLDRVVEELKE